MIGMISGKVISCDTEETIVLTSNGVGYQLFVKDILTIGEQIQLYTTCIYKENEVELYGHRTFEEKKFFELLLSVKGVGPKCAYSLVKSLSLFDLKQAIMLENKNMLRKAPGIGPKAAAQIILDLKEKIKKVHLHSSSINTTVRGKENVNDKKDSLAWELPLDGENKENFSIPSGQKLKALEEALLACKELGLNEEEVLPIANRIMQFQEIKRAEQLVQMILKEM